MRVLLLAVFVLTMVGCGGTTLFAKPGAGVTEFESDKYECEQRWEQTAGAIAFRLDPMGNAYFGFTRSGEIKACLEHRGWAQQDG